MPSDEKSKLCFVIGPIGQKGSPERRFANWLLKGVIKPVLEGEPFKYVVQRADEFTSPGLITDQVITAALEADLVVADLTGHNANAFYELAIRHMVNKPVIHLYRRGEPLPFDLKDQRSIEYSVDEIEELEETKSALFAQASAIAKGGDNAHNPITRARGFQKLANSADPRDKVIADLSAKMERIESQLSALHVLADQMDPAKSSAGFFYSPNSSFAVTEELRSGLPGRSSVRFYGGGHPRSLNQLTEIGRWVRKSSGTVGDETKASPSEEGGVNPDKETKKD